jgi:hypothetical protein
MTPEQHAGAERCARFAQDGLHGYRLDQLEKMAEDCETRLQAIELELPTLRLVRNWIMKAAVGALGVVGLAVVALVLR